MRDAPIISGKVKRTVSIFTHGSEEYPDPLSRAAFRTAVRQLEVALCGPDCEEDEVAREGFEVVEGTPHGLEASRRVSWCKQQRGSDLARGRREGDPRQQGQNCLFLWARQGRWIDPLLWARKGRWIDPTQRRAVPDTVSQSLLSFSPRLSAAWRQWRQRTRRRIQGFQLQDCAGAVHLLRLARQAKRLREGARWRCSLEGEAKG